MGIIKSTSQGSKISKLDTRSWIYRSLFTSSVNKLSPMLCVSTLIQEPRDVSFPSVISWLGQAEHWHCTLHLGTSWSSGVNQLYLGGHHFCFTYKFSQVSMKLDGILLTIYLIYLCVRLTRLKDHVMFIDKTESDIFGANLILKSWMRVPRYYSFYFCLW